jgi:hypothetical protein
LAVASANAEVTKAIAVSPPDTMPLTQGPQRRHVNRQNDDRFGARLVQRLPGARLQFVAGESELAGGCSAGSLM